jgi:hypothetical protein
VPAVVTMMWLTIALVLAGVAVIGWAYYAAEGAPIDEATRRVFLSLHAIHYRMERDQFRSELRRDSARARRELRKALDEQDDASQGRG